MSKSERGVAKVEEVGNSSRGGFGSQGVAAALSDFIHAGLSVTDRGDLALSLSLSGDVLHLRCVFTSSAFGCEMFLTARPTAASGSIFAVWEYQVLWRILLTHVPPTGCGCHSYVARVRTLRVGGQWKSFGTGVVVTCSHWDTTCRIEI